MWKRSSLVLILAAFVAFTSSCILDPEPGDPPVDPPPPWPDRNTREEVLETLQRAYNERNADQYKNMLDDGFVFYLSDGDVNNGLPVQWDVGVERDATSNLLSRTKVGDLPLVRSIDMDVQFEDGVTWVEVIPQSAPTETWYTTTAFYNFQITVDQDGTDEDLTYYPYPNSKAQFTVRNVGTASAPKWELVEWRDLGAGT